MNKNNQPKINAGFTLIELLISMVLSIFLIGGVIAIYISSHNTAHVREEMSSVDDNARAAIRSLTQVIEHAGYATPMHIAFDDYIVKTGGTTNNGICGDAGGNIDMTDTSSPLKDTNDGTGSNSDVITVTALADDLMNVDCSGQVQRAACRVGSAANIQGAKIYNSFYIQTPAGETEPSLFCRGSVAASAVQIADGIEDMQLRYGVDLNADLIVDKYVTASQATGLWQNIVSVQVALLVRSLKNVKKENESQTFQLLDKTVVTNDRRQRSVFTTEISLRNVLL